MVRLPDNEPLWEMTTYRPTNWEYKLVEYGGSLPWFEAELNDAAREGYELWGKLNIGHQEVCILRRPHKVTETSLDEESER